MQMKVLTFLSVSNIAYHHQIAMCAIAHLSSYAPTCCIVALNSDGVHVLMRATAQKMPHTVWLMAQEAVVSLCTSIPQSQLLIV